MPEGDTIRRLADSLEAKYAGCTVERSLFRHPRYSTLDFAGSKLLETDAHGKHLLLRFSNDLTIHIHLRMYGTVALSYPRGSVSYRRKLELKLSKGWIVAIDTPILQIIKTRDENRILGHLGPSVCGEYDHHVGLHRISAAGDRPVAQAMLDQTLVAGFGNIYAVETPFIVGINPHTSVSSIANLDGLLAIGVGLIRANARLGPQNTTGRDLNRSKHWVLSTHTHTCAVCGSKVERIRGPDSAWQRRTAWCVECQPIGQVVVDLERASRLIGRHPCHRLVDIKQGKLIADTSKPVRTESLRLNEAYSKRMR